jgi:uncharacterized damage-inducible protein DinB
MMYNSVPEIFQAMDATRNRLYARVGGLSEAQESARAAEGAWSVREIVEHLAIMEERLSRMMAVMLAKAESAGAPSAAQAMQPFTLDHFIEGNRGQKFQAPEQVRPTGEESIAALLERLRASRNFLSGLQQRMEATDLSAMSYPHPAFGPLNVYQWLALIGLHEERHLAQIESLLASTEPIN